jgi:hypothetical protein
MDPREILARTSTRRRGGKGIPGWMWWIIIAVPGLFVFLGIGLLVDAVQFTSDAQSTRGEVVHIRTNHDSEGGVSYTPTIEYRRDDGRLLEAETHISSSNYDYDIGAKVDILYSYEYSGEVRIDSVFSLYGPGLIFAAIGLLFIGITLFARSKTGGKAGGAGLKPVAATERARRGPWSRTGAEPDPEPETTDPSKPGHVHKPKPKRTPTIRRMR